RRLANRFFERNHQNPIASQRLPPRPDVLHVATVLELLPEDVSIPRINPTLNRRLISVDQRLHVVLKREPLIDRSQIVFGVVEGGVNLLCGLTEREDDERRPVQGLERAPRRRRVQVVSRALEPPLRAPSLVLEEPAVPRPTVSFPTRPPRDER